MRKYFAVVDRLRQQPTTRLDELTTVATSTQLTALKLLLQRERHQGLHQTGTTKIRRLKVQSVNLNNPDPAAGKAPTVQVDVCVDVSQVDILNRNGKSTVRPGRPDTGWTRYIVANYHYAADPVGGWRVATGQDLKKALCAAF